LAETGHKVALAEAVAEARQQEQDLADQLDLFEQGLPRAASVPIATEPRGAGRPIGARNKRTDEAARFYIARFGDPLSRGVEISALPILANGGQVLLELAKILGMTRENAAKWWAGVYAATLPYIHQRLATLTVKPPGSPEGEPVSLSWSYGEDEVLDHLELIAPAGDRARE
jgi:hypothetical protein